MDDKDDDCEKKERKGDEHEVKDEFLKMVAGGVVTIPMRQKPDVKYW